MAIFTHKNISQGSVAIRLRCSGIFSNQFTITLLPSLPMKEFWKSVKIWRSYCYEFGVVLFGTRCRYLDSKKIKKRKMHTRTALALKSFANHAWGCYSVSVNLDGFSCDGYNTESFY